MRAGYTPVPPESNPAYAEAEQIAGEMARSDPAQYVDDAGQIVDTSIDKANNVAEENLRTMQGDWSSALSDALKAAGILDGYTIQTITRTMGSLFGEDTMKTIWGRSVQMADTMANFARRFATTVLPQLEGASMKVLNQFVSTVGSLMGGELPQDTVDFLQKTAAERFGERGAEFYSYRGMAEIGKTSYDAILAGLQAAPGVSEMVRGVYGISGQGMGLYQAAYGAAAGLADVRNALWDPIGSRLTDPTKLFGASFAARRAQRLDPNAVFSSSVNAGMQAFGYGIDERLAGLQSLTNLAHFGLNYTQDERVSAYTAVANQQNYNDTQRALDEMNASLKKPSTPSTTTNNYYF